MSPTAGAFPLYDADFSVARNWNEALLAAIRRDFARPTVHARNLFHSSALMYDLWALYQGRADTYFLGQRVHGFHCPLNPTQRAELVTAAGEEIEQARETAISFGMYRLLTHRFASSPGVTATQDRFDALMLALGHDTSSTGRDPGSASAVELGNYLADCIIRYGLQDGANEQNGYQNRLYQPVNPAMNPALSGTPGLVDPDRWQPLEFESFVDQAGNVTSTPFFLGAEWGQVQAFALGREDRSDYQRAGAPFPVYLDPGPPALLRSEQADPGHYQWNHALVVLWSGHLDPADEVVWDISPAAIGNTADLPRNADGLRSFFLALDGGVNDRGHRLNPFTNAAYAPQRVRRGDYTRVLAEFWADGPDSETPPGHWFTILNELVSDHPVFERRYQGQGEPLTALEWDVKAYFVLGAAMHDAAVAAWSIKGWYDYVRPISAIRNMARLGQSSDPGRPRFHPEGIPLTPGRIEIIEAGDALAGIDGQHVGEIKLYAWRGPNFIEDPHNDLAGVGWIRAADWWPYQRPTFVTPPFAGYVSGHSTFSRAAAEVLTSLTGDAFFPGGLGEFHAPKNEFLVFEAGPSEDVTLQWATYRDASDQTSLSRIWGGIHPPIDDIPGRLVGIKIADRVNALSARYFGGQVHQGAVRGEASGSGPFGLASALLLVVCVLTRQRRRSDFSECSAIRHPTRSSQGCPRLEPYARLKPTCEDR